MSQQDWDAALLLVEAVPPADEHYADALSAAFVCFERLLSNLQTGEQSNARQQEDTLNRARRLLQPVVTGPDNRWPESWTGLQLSTATQLARLHLRYSTRHLDYAERLLRSAWNGARQSSHHGELLKSIAPLLITSLAIGAHYDEAAQVLNGAIADSPIALHETAALLAERLDHIAEDQQPHQSALLLAALERLREHQDKLSPQQASALQLYQAAALAAAGRRDEALRSYEELARQYPTNGDIQEAYTLLLSKSDSSEKLRIALQRWETIERRSRRGGTRWMRARRARIELLRRLGDNGDAEKLIQLTRLLYPNVDI